MIRLLRIVGVMLIVAGVLVLASWSIAPLAAVWVAIFMLPLPIQIGLGVAGVGFVLLLAALIWERLEDRASEGDLLHDEPIRYPPEPTPRREGDSTDDRREHG